MNKADRSAKLKQRYEQRKAAGVCVTCGRDRDSELSRCSRCRTWQVRANEQQRARSITQGTCRVCAAPKFKAGACERHYEQRKAYDRNLLAQGFCTWKHPLDEKGFCKQCSDRGKRRNAQLKQEAINAYGGVCACCSEAQPMFLQIDHINGRHSADGKEKLFGGPMYRKLRNAGWPSGYQVLCANCNFAKGMYGTCPHVA